MVTIARLLMAVALVFAVGCRSSEKTRRDGEPSTAGDSSRADDKSRTAEGAMQGNAGTSGHNLREQVIDCAQAPEAAACCEALTPSCNDCRESERKRRDLWLQACAKHASVTPKACGGNPPVANCCGDDTDECRQCRQDAMTRLLAWKDACSGIDSSCDKKPVPSMCCQAMIPSCEACKERNRRMLFDWQKRCAG